MFRDEGHTECPREATFSALTEVSDEKTDPVLLEYRVLVLDRKSAELGAEHPFA